MLILKFAVLTCALAVLIALLFSMLCYTRLRLAEIKARDEVKGAAGPEAPKHAPGSVDEGFENIMTFSVGEKKGGSL